MEEEDSLSNTFKILVATDNHLGYGETNQAIEKDSFDTFEEILQIANRESVDFILLGGDLFHETKPSTFCINKCIELIRKYCLGDKAIEFELLSEPSVNFSHSTIANYENPNMNIAIPIFSIHGNHDDPSGKQHLSALDVLSSAGLINYFGRCDDLTSVELHPVLLKKGETQVALYGLSHIRDERLARLLIEKKVAFAQLEKMENWFNIFVLHQNRARNRGTKNFIPETFIPNFIDLAIWGHEHDCQIRDVATLSGDVYIIQPGSSVATSLAEGESIPKCVGVLKIQHKQFSITPIELKTVRPFVFKQITLDPVSNVDDDTVPSDITKAQIRTEIINMLKNAKKLKRNENMLPLLRLIVYYYDEQQIFNSIRFGQEFSKFVANPEDILKFAPLLKKSRTRLKIDDSNDDIEEPDHMQRVEDLLERNFNQAQLSVLNLAGLNAAVRRFIDSSDTDSPSFIIDNQEQYILNKLKELKPQEEEIDDVIKNIQVNRSAAEFENILRKKNTSKRKDIDDIITINDDDDDDVADDLNVSNTSNEKPARGRRPRGGRGSRSTGSRSRGNGKMK